MSTPTPPSPERGSVRPTAWSTLAVLCVVGIGIGVVSEVVQTSTGGALPVPFGTATLMLAVALAAVVLRRRAVRRLQGGKEPLASEEAVWSLAVAKSAMLAGAFGVGLFAAWCGLAVPRLDAPRVRERALHSALAAVSATLMILTGRRLEMALRVPDPPEHEDKDFSTSSAWREGCRRQGS